MNDYLNLPWSKTPLAPLFHKSVAVPGNTNTINLSKLSFRSNKDRHVISSNASANYKMLIQMAEDPKDDKSYFSMDTGVNGHPFQGNYFDMNQDHVTGNLKPMKWTFEKMIGTKVGILTLSPPRKRKTTQAK